ncbi:MAG TPA: Calx-beta domain-containing protein [Chthoniobacterales bacterium]|jgi:uncharacterized delta-60 repeat protein|nr:Calx-beta domain-containing protein [Chthoniobacterales bacterium]
MKSKTGKFFPFFKSAKLRLACLSLLWLCPESLLGAGGDIDPTFLAGAGPDSTVSAIAFQPDGKILIGGNFASYDGTARGRLARLHPNGQLDLGFDQIFGSPGSVTDNVSAIVAVPDVFNDIEFILIAGNFTTFNGAARGRIARLKDNGDIDNNFAPVAGANGEILAMVVQSDGKIIIGGKFTTYDNVARQKLARLNANGTLDTTFNPSGVGPNGDVHSIALTPSGGKIVIGGLFSNYNTTGPAANVARLNSDGTQDLTFDTSPGANAVVRRVAVQPDGKVIIGGDFSSYASVARGGVARLNTNGTLDTTFDPGTVANAGTTGMALQEDGKIALVGFFTSFNGVSRNRVARLNSNGSLDTTFNPGSGTTGIVNTVAIEPADGKILIGGSFLTYNGISRPRLARLSTAPGEISFFIISNIAPEQVGAVSYSLTRSGGTDNRVNATIALSDQTTSPSDYLGTGAALDPSFNPGTGLGGGHISSVVRQPDNKILIGGFFFVYNGVGRTHIARVHPDGSLDTTFNPGTGPGDTVLGVTLQPDGKILLVGTFPSYNGTSRNRIVRINSNGSLDTSFDPGVGADLGIEECEVQSDGKILIVGRFTKFNNVSRKGVARLNANGTLDTTFDPGTGPDGPIFGAVLRADGSAVIVGEFLNYNGIPCKRMARLNSDGSLDTSFVGEGPDQFISDILQQPDGKLFIIGGFTTIQNRFRTSVARLEPDGKLDFSFNPAVSAFDFGGPNSIINLNGTLQPDGKLLIGGSFTAFSGVTRNHLVRLNSDGSVDSTFDPGLGANDVVHAFAVEPGGRIIIGGLFTTYQGVARSRLARIVQGDLVVTWPAGDATSKQIDLGVVDDALDENTENAKLNLASLTGDATLKAPSAAFLQINDNDPAPTLQFSPSTYSVSEEVGVVLITVTKTGGTELTSTVHFTTANGTAIAGDDYIGVSGDLTFLPAETSKNISVTIANDSGKEGDETFTVSLDTPSNATLGAATSATVTIQANDDPNATPTPSPTPGGSPTATPTPAPGLVGNVSTRLPVGTGENVLIEGFIVLGPDGSTKKIMVRALGPFLTQFGINDALANPTLEIRDGTNTVVATNNDWRNTQVGGIITSDQAAEIEGSGLAPTNDFESAIIANLVPGSYTAVVRGVSDTVGTGIVDAYDLSPASPARLANVATRGLIRPGDQLMIAGFITQSGDVRAVLRAIGPSLSGFGINNALPDTTLQLRDVNGAMVRENDDWESDQKSELESTGLQPGDPREAALVVTLAPGQYTAQVRGKPETTGIGVVELYFLQ